MTKKAVQEIEQKGIFNLYNGVCRCVDTDDYVRSFGFQWNKFEKTQIDRFDRGISQSKLRLFAETGWEEGAYEGENILEVGSGAGRFTRVLLENTKAAVCSLDYSTAVEANERNNGHFGDRLKLFQASIYAMPFKPAQFDKVVCLGVLQHTPDFQRSIACLADMVKPGGELIIDFYPIKGWWTKIHAKYIFRPITKRMSHEKLLSTIERNAAWLIKAYFFFERIGVGRIINRFLPICDIKHTLPQGLTAKELKEWVILDTFDMFSPAHDHPQEIETVKGWVENSGLFVTFHGFIALTAGKAAVVRAVRQ